MHSTLFAWMFLANREKPVHSLCDFDEIDPSSEACTPCVPPAVEPGRPEGRKIPDPKSEIAISSKTVILALLKTATPG